MILKLFDLYVYAIPSGVTSCLMVYGKLSVSKNKTLEVCIIDLFNFCGYDGDNMNYEPAKMIIYNEAAISMAKCNNDAGDNR